MVLIAFSLKLFVSVFSAHVPTAAHAVGPSVIPEYENDVLIGCSPFRQATKLGSAGCFAFRIFKALVPWQTPIQDATAFACVRFRTFSISFYYYSMQSSIEALAIMP
jgi:hypothetical protein